MSYWGWKKSAKECPKDMLEDLEYYTDEAMNDLNTQGNTASLGRFVFIKIKDQYYKLSEARTGKDKHGFRHSVNYYVIHPIEASKVRESIRELIYHEDGYKDSYSYEAPFTHADAMRLMEMGAIMAHERYNAYFKIEDGVMMDYWPEFDREENGYWDVFEAKNYQHSETLTEDNRYIGWRMAENYLEEEAERKAIRAEYRKSKEAQ